MPTQNPWKTAGVANILTPGAAIGDVFYVDGSNGDDDSNGLDPMSPLLTITYALSLCTDDENDVIIVLNYPETHPGGDEDSPIVINKNRVHLLGAAYPYKTGDPKAYLQTPDAAAPVFHVTARWCEIAYFKLAGGTGHGCIKLDDADGVIETKGLSVHHCVFAEKYNATAGSPTYGIDASDTNVGNWMMITKNRFYQPIQGSAIIIDSAANPHIVDNMFLCCGDTDGDPILDLSAHPSGYGVITDNYFGIATANVALVGAAITLGANTYGFLIANNMANSGMATMAANPYSDTNLGVANKNAWMGNIKGDAYQAPA